MTRIVVRNTSSLVSVRDADIMVLALQKLCVKFCELWSRTTRVVKTSLYTTPGDEVYTLSDTDSSDLRCVNVKKILEMGGVVLWKDTSTLTVASVLSRLIFSDILDRQVNMWVEGNASENNGSELVAMEACYAVCDTLVKVDIGDISVGLTNFVLPAWFDRNTDGVRVKVDYLGLLTSPFSASGGGFIIVSSDAIRLRYSSTVCVEAEASSPTSRASRRMGSTSVVEERVFTRKKAINEPINVDPPRGRKGPRRNPPIEIRYKKNNDDVDLVEIEITRKSRST